MVLFSLIDTAGPSSTDLRNFSGWHATLLLCLPHPVLHQVKKKKTSHLWVCVSILSRDCSGLTNLSHYCSWKQEGKCASASSASEILKGDGRRIERGLSLTSLVLLPIIFFNTLIIFNAYHVPVIKLGDLYTLF